MRSDALPEGWRATTLRNVSADVRYGYTASAEDEPVGPRFLRITDIVGGHVDWSAVPHCEINAQDERKYELLPGDIVIARTGASAGASHYCQPPEPAVFASYLVRFRTDRDKAVPHYVAYVLRSLTWWNYVRGAAGGSAQPQLNAQVMGDFSFPLPPVPDQERVVHVLSALDDKIDSNRRLARLLEETAAALFRARFVDFVGVEEFEDSEIGPIPAGWKAETLGALATTHKLAIEPATAPEAEFEHFSIPAYDAGCAAIREAGRQMLSAKTALPDGDCVLLSKLNPATKRVWWPKPSGAALSVCSPEFVVLQPKSGVPNTYLYAVCAHDDRFYDQLLSHATGTTGSRQRVKPSEVMVATILVPSPDCLVAWDRVARPLFDHAHALGVEVRTLASLRDVLLPKLISGEIRVPDMTDLAEVIEPLVA
jgi:type I restriction enzyme S subunit